MAITYVLPPWCPQQFFDANGDPVASGTVYFYQPGTTTAQQTYSDTSGTLNASPGVPLNASGRPTSGAIYLDASLGYKLVLKDSAGATISTYDPLYTPPTSSTINAICQGRLTATSGTPVTTADVSGATSIYWTPYGGNQIALYDGVSAWNIRTFAEITISLVGLTASKPYDVFAYDNATVVTCETLAWTNATTRATALTLQNGVLVKSGATTRRYLGTVFINSSGGQTDDTLKKRYLWNYYNRTPRALFVQDTTNTWTYSTATWRQANGSTANQVEFIIGVAEVPVWVTVLGGFQNNNLAIGAAVGVGVDVTNAASATSLLGRQQSYVINSYIAAQSHYTAFLAVGYHFLAWLEYSEATATTTWYGDNGGGDIGPRAGMNGSIDG